MPTICLYDDSVTFPAWVTDLASFRRWYRSDDFPETGRILFLGGDVWIDMSKEQIFSHAEVKSEFGAVLRPLAKADRQGHYIVDGVLVSNVEADLAAQPDGVYFSNDALRAGRVVLVEGAAEGFVELEGVPEMVLEVVSDSSVTKDTVTLRRQYWEAGIPEYWLADARGERPTFDILRHTAKGYVAVKRQGGWLKSSVFGRSFRLTRATDALGHPEFTLEVR